MITSYTIRLFDKKNKFFILIRYPFTLSNKKHAHKDHSPRQKTQSQICSLRMSFSHHNGNLSHHKPSRHRKCLCKCKHNNFFYKWCLQWNPRQQHLEISKRKPYSLKKNQNHKNMKRSVIITMMCIMSLGTTYAQGIFKLQKGDTTFFTMTITSREGRKDSTYFIKAIFRDFQSKKAIANYSIRIQESKSESVMYKTSTDESGKCAFPLPKLKGYDIVINPHDYQNGARIFHILLPEWEKDVVSLRPFTL